MVADFEEAFETAGLFGRELSDQEPPRPVLGTLAGTGAQALKDAEPRKKHLVFDQPPRGEVDEAGRRVVAGPGATPQPAQERHMPLPGTEHGVAVVTTDGPLVHQPARDAT